jgi:hypothetical protein
VIIPVAARADVERIREKAVELQQKLQKQAFESAAKVDPANSARIYKDYDFLLGKSKVDEVAADAKTDPEADALRLYLIRSSVNAQLATYVDDLRNFEASNTADYDGKNVRMNDLVAQLAVTPEDSDRRKLISALSPLFDTAAVFRNEILKRRNDTYATWGFAHFSDFYTAREGTDLTAVSAMADTLLGRTQALYDSLFTVMADRVLHTEARKVRFYDLPYLTQGTAYEKAFPAADRVARMRDVFKGLGVDVKGQSNLTVDVEARPGKATGVGVYAATVPSDVRVSLKPLGGIRDDDRLVYGVGEAEIFALSTQTAFEPAYLPRVASQATLAYLSRLVLDEPGWFQGQVKGDGFDQNAYETYRAFVSLYEGRMLAAQAKFGIAAYEGGANLDDTFKTLMESATGSRVSSSDSKRALEYLDQLDSVGRLQGLLLAAAVREDLVKTLGPDWYTGGNAASVLTGLWKQGGALTLADIGSVCGGAQPDVDAWIRHINSLVAPGASQ